MSHLHINLAIDDQTTALQWKAAIAYRLRALADQVAGSTGALEVREDWPDLEGWPQVADPYTGPEDWPVVDHPRPGQNPPQPRQGAD